MKKIIALAMIMLSINSYGHTRAAEFGIRINHGIADGTTSNDKLGFQGGIIFGMPINDVLTFRTGGVLAIKDSEVEAFGAKASASRLFLDVPATLQFGNNVIQAYAGFNIGLKLSSSCSRPGPGSCSIQDEKTLVLQPVIGADFPIANLWSLGFFYEFETQYSKDYKQSAYGLNANYTF